MSKSELRKTAHKAYLAGLTLLTGIVSLNIGAIIL